ncbi:hypothetical protein SAMN05216410_0937 [Sanguibacter gelidistatuariae]|uniref:Uncharacterized protein n=1 Tax=Sanguibacter gelidistatuariae TaxID=1814289 RepID=A0A1G6HD23_9MICO|nr:hypothetical protein [Sanguibacter gelidistatuariae]SDB92179.1 hypothetical protein SAMN05216410_0937 [Sanguibacter gelidistatuariae]
MATSSAGRLDLFDLSARLWMRAYPRRWRATYGTDLLGMLADVAPERARTVPVREGLAVLRAGWALRWREHPRFWLWLGYRLLNRRLPGRYRYWVIDDLLGPLYDARTFLAAFPIFFVPMFMPDWFPGESSVPPDGVLGFVVVWCIFVVLVSMAFKFYARQVWNKHIGGPYPTALLPLWHRVAVRRTARAASRQV